MRSGETSMEYRETSVALLAVILLAIIAGCAARPNTAIQGNFADAKAVIGDWKRSAGGYRLLIREIEGGIRVEYESPSQGNVRVSQSKMRIKDSKIQIEITLNDVNYPGSNYDLMYDENTDTIKGTYTYPQGTMYVSFVRGKSASK